MHIKIVSQAQWLDNGLIGPSRPSPGGCTAFCHVLCNMKNLPFDMDERSNSFLQLSASQAKSSSVMYQVEVLKHLAVQ